MDALVEKLKARRYDAHHVHTKEEAVELALTMVRPDDTVAYGGSMTLVETGMLDALRKAPCRLLDRANAKSPDEAEFIMREGLNADVYFASVNAMDLSGVIYQTEGRGNRVASIMFGAKKVVLIVGRNKIVKDKAAAEERMRLIACPKNAARLHRDTPCVQVGHCVDCIAPGSVCGSRVEMRFSYLPGRIAVILVDEELGY